VAAPSAAAALPSRELCERSATVSLRNRGNACYDSQPNPLTPPVAEVPASCPRVPPGLPVTVHVSVTGDVTGNPIPARRSPCAAFQSVAIATAQNLRFQPAKKNGQPVSAWTQVLIRPARR
jgi:hypothetical protein